MAEANKTNHSEKLLQVTKAEQYSTVNELFEHSRPSGLYYTLLTLSAVIIALGLLLDNGAIVIGGMLVTPILTPLLVVALGLAVGEVAAVRQTAVLMLKSFLLVVAVAFVVSFLLGSPSSLSIFDNSVRTAVLYFLVALASGVAATMAWVRKEVREVLPGIAIAVSLVPPLCLVGIWLSVFELNTARFYLFVFILNLFGVLVGSLVVFSLLKFYKTSGEVEAKASEIKKYR